jgi:DNA-binding response OmpR family regulator
LQQAASPRGLEVLVIDDPAVARMVRMNLLSEGYRVRIAIHGEDGLNRIAESEPDVIVLDLQMPVMDGRAFFLEARSRGCGAPVIILSAYGADRARAELGAERSVAKPFEPDQLVSAIREVLHQ